MTGLPDPQTAYALLIGVAEYDNPLHRPLPTCYRSVEKLDELLRAKDDGSMWQLPEGRIETLGPKVLAYDARRALRDAVAKPGLEALLVCISCHGYRFDDDGYSPSGLYLAMSDSLSEMPNSYLGFHEVRNALGQAARDYRIPHVLLIIDSCWSDNTSLDSFMGSAEAAEADALAVHGVITLTATRKRVQAWPHLPGTDWTAFMGALIGVVEDGIPGPYEILTSRQIYAEAEQRLAKARRTEPNIPEPDINVLGLSDIPLCRNKQYKPPEPISGDDPASSSGVIPEFANADDCFRAVESAHREGRTSSIAEMVRSFCGGAGASEIAELAAKLQASQFSAFDRFAYTAVCAGRRPDEIAGFVHSLHLNGVLVHAGRILAHVSDRARPALGILEVFEALHFLDCPSCMKVAESMSAKVVDDPVMSRDVLARWHEPVVTSQRR